MKAIAASRSGSVDNNLNTYQSSKNEIKSVTVGCTNKDWTLDVVNKIEKDLDMHDTISLVFLLYENQIALNVILTILSAGPLNFSKDLISKWAYIKPHNWWLILIEALSVIQNNIVLVKLGYSKSEIKRQFQQRKGVSPFINRIKKTLYLLCENLTPFQAEDLIDRVRNDGNFHNDITTKFDSNYLEFHLLFWISRGYLNIEQEISLRNLTKHLKSMNLLNRVKEIDNEVESINCEKRTISNTQQFDVIDVYPIKDPENVGLCIIVNMAQFKKNVEKKRNLRHLLPQEPLDDREGSLKDVSNLKETFAHLKFLVVEVHDVFHNHLELKIQSIVKEKFQKNIHSVLVLCVLSHGDKGIVYAANSIPVQVHTIQNIISGDTPVEDLLANIPKVIVIQACQGRSPLYVETKSEYQDEKDDVHKSNWLNFDGSGLTFDGPDQFSPKYADVLTCLSIIQGFVAVRSVKEGTKYVQEFCKCLKEYYKRDHLLDIVTRVHNNLNSNRMHISTGGRGEWNCTEHRNCLCIYMTPEAKHTLRKKLYLTMSAMKPLLL